MIDINSQQQMQLAVAKSKSVGMAAPFTPHQAYTHQ